MQVEVHLWRLQARGRWGFRQNSATRQGWRENWAQCGRNQATLSTTVDLGPRPPDQDVPHAGWKIYSRGPRRRVPHRCFLCRLPSRATTKGQTLSIHRRGNHATPTINRPQQRYRVNHRHETSLASRSRWVTNTFLLAWVWVCLHMFCIYVQVPMWRVCRPTPVKCWALLRARPLLSSWTRCGKSCRTMLTTFSTERWTGRPRARPAGDSSSWLSESKGSSGCIWWGKGSTSLRAQSSHPTPTLPLTKLDCPRWHFFLFTSREAAWSCRSVGRKKENKRSHFCFFGD